MKRIKEQIADAYFYLGNNTNLKSFKSCWTFRSSTGPSSPIKNKYVSTLNNKECKIVVSDQKDFINGHLQRNVIRGWKSSTATKFAQKFAEKFRNIQANT